MYLLVLGVILGIMGTKAWEYKNNKGMEISKTLYVLGGLWLAWVMFTVMLITINIGEGETRAAGLGALIFGGVTLLGFLAIRWFYNEKKLKNTSKSIEA